MSSTKRGGQRSPSDDYQTPSWCVRRLMDYWKTLVFNSTPTLGSRWLEPCAGRGNIIQAIGNAPGEIIWRAVEMREECQTDLLTILPEKQVDCPADFFEWAVDNQQRKRYDVTITNPPYRLAQEFIETSMALTRGLVVMLLRLNYTGAKKRFAFFREHPPTHILLLPNRPPFTEDGKTDSIEYAWFVWDTRPRSRVVTQFEWLDLTPLDERKCS